MVVFGIKVTAHYCEGGRPVKRLSPKWIVNFSSIGHHREKNAQKNVRIE